MKDLLVLDKPPDMPIHPSMGNYEIHWPTRWYITTSSRNGPSSSLHQPAGSGYVRTTYRGKKCLQQRCPFRPDEGTAHPPEYLAVVQGLAPERGTIDAPHRPPTRFRYCAVCRSRKGEPAITHYTRVAASPDGTYSLMRIHLDTGRTHQIRVHMGHTAIPLLRGFPLLSRLPAFWAAALHSHRLSFTHPVTGEEMTFTSPCPKIATRTGLCYNNRECFAFSRA